MKIIEAYQTSDGRIFENCNDAESHQFDLVGEALDAFIPRCPNGRITEIDRHRLLLEILKQPDIKALISELQRHIEGSDSDRISRAAIDQIKYIKGEQ